MTSPWLAFPSSFFGFNSPEALCGGQARSHPLYMFPRMVNA